MRSDQKSRFVSSPRLYITGRDPRDGGGVASMAKFAYATAERAGYDPCLVCNMLDRETQIRLTDVRDWFGVDLAERVRHMTVDGMEVKGVPLIVPEVEFTQYLLNEPGWEAALDDGDVFFAVAGTNQCCLPLTRQEDPFGSWTATLLWDDRTDRLKSRPWLERVRDRLSRPALEYIERKAYRAAEPLMVLSEYTASRLAEHHGIDRDRMSVVPYPIDTERFSPVPEDGDPATDGPTVLFVGRLNDPRKNVELLIDAFSKVHESVPGATLWLVGAEPNADVATAARESGAGEAIEFHDRVPNEELPEYYRAADLFVIPSDQEGLAIVGLESMACGTPVVSTRCGGPEGYVRDGETGYLVERDDTDALADRIETVLSDEERRTEMGRQARKLIEQRYARSKIEPQFVDAFATLESD